MTQSFPIHQSLPSGFTVANDSQVDHYVKTGFVPGASKVTAFEVAPAYARAIDFNLGSHLGVDEPLNLAFRLRPPRIARDVNSPLGARDVERHDLAWYIAQYNKGWAAARSGTDSREWNSGMSSDSFDDGYLDGAAGRAKWHLTYCLDHDTCGEG